MSENKTKIVKLDSPIQFGSESIAEITLRKPVAGDLKGFPLKDQEVDDVLNLISKLSAQPASVIEKLDVEDFMKVADALGELSPVSLLTGPKL